MNDKAIDNILSRRSIRQYDPMREIPAQLRELIIECACAAPSARNLRPWRFIVVDGRERLSVMAEALPYGKMLGTASLAIVVCGLTKGEGDYSYWEEDCSASMQNILLAANALELGSVWIGIRHSNIGLEDKLKEMFGIPEEIAVLGVAAIGYPAMSRDSHKGIEPQVVHVNKW